MYTYLMHRFYKFPLQSKPEVTERDMIFVPSGWDSHTLIGEFQKSMLKNQGEEEWSSIFPATEAVKMDLEEETAEDY